MTTQKTTEHLSAFFDDYVEEMHKILKSGEVEVVADKETGEKVAIKKTLSPAMASVMRQLLKDNGITATPANSKLARLADDIDKLPFEVPDDTGGEPTYQ